MKLYEAVRLNEEELPEGTIINFKSFYSSDTGDKIEPGKYTVTPEDKDYILANEEKELEFRIKKRELDVLMLMDMFVKRVAE